MCGVTTCIAWGFAIIYLFAAQGCEAFTTTCKNYRLRHRKLSAIEQLTDKALYIRHSSVYLQSVMSNDRVRAMSVFSAFNRKTSMMQTEGSSEEHLRKRNKYQSLANVHARNDSLNDLDVEDRKFSVNSEP